MAFNKSVARKFGNWAVGLEKFNDKIEAAVHATRSNTDLVFEFNNTVWDSFDRSRLGKIRLAELYRQRAQQLRDKYDYLVLYYSGGADSTNILDTFINNNIKLDCVYVRWPFDVLNSTLHMPNKQDKSAFNFNSEWDYATKPRLDWLAKNHPEIKIELKGVEGLTDSTQFNDDSFSGVNNRYSPVNILRKGTYSDFERDCIDKNKSVGQISGIDKPMLAQSPQGVVSMKFVDDFLHTLNVTPFNSLGVEYFYWSVDLPELAFEMAYQVFQYYNHNPRERYLVPGREYTAMPADIKHACREKFFMDIKSVCYPTWNNAIFQTEKPRHRFGIDKDVWFFKSTEFVDTRKVWSYYYKSRMDAISDRFCEFDPLGNKTGVAPISTKSFTIGQWMQE
jgi:hypothetical protein